MLTSRRHGGFRLGRKLLSAWRWALCHRRRRGYLRLQPCRGAAQHQAPPPQPRRPRLAADADVGPVPGAADEAPAPPQGQGPPPAARRLTGGGDHAQGAGRGVRRRRGARRRVHALRGARRLLQPPAVRGAAARGRGGVRVPAPRRDHHPLRRLAVRARRRRGRGRRRRRREEGAWMVVARGPPHLTSPCGDWWLVYIHYT
ncbi:hypothetical protein PR202_gb09209 [Eleusine coracana subsp. coracana]|uniref:Uncharacterized protein n=1 Tax=Eleusine coracana subsp. coracana TaxID=191504 RepID=A0AAV5EE66_ELECO|nr:hypothetical protein PR202_gb09209 [Eleusine coracana subsp. coracana]